MLRVIALAFIFTVGFRTLTNKFPTQAATINTVPVVVINEVMPNPDGVDSLNEWIELYNTTNETINLEGWTIQNKPLSGSIMPKGYLIVARNKENLSLYYSNLNIIEASISLINSAGNLELRNKDNQLVSKFEYSLAVEGVSFESIGSGGNLEICSDVVGSSYGNTIGNQNSITYLDCTDSTTQIFFSLDNKNFSSNINVVGPVTVYIDVKTDLESVHTTRYYDDTNKLFNNPIVIDNYVDRNILIELEDFEGRIYKKFSEPVSIYPNLLINEVFVGNEDWIEIYNPNEFDVEIKDYKFNISGEYSCSIISAKDYCLFLATQDIGGKKLGMRINSLLVDEVQANASSSFYNNKWVQGFAPTPLEENIPNINMIYINEVYPSPESGEEEWIEIYNSSNYQIDIDGWYFSEERNGGNCVSNTSFGINQIDAKTYLVIKGKDLKVSLNNSGDDIYLCSSDNKIVSEVSYGELEKGFAFSKIINEESFVESDQPTPGFPNVKLSIGYLEKSQVDLSKFEDDISVSSILGKVFDNERQIELAEDIYKIKGHGQMNYKADLSLLFASIFAVIILLLYLVYITKVDKLLVGYIKSKNEKKVPYFKTKITRKEKI